MFFWTEELLHPTFEEAALSSKIKLMSKLSSKVKMNKNVQMKLNNKINQKLLLKRLSYAKY